jgi:hypothetical protein
MGNDLANMLSKSSQPTNNLSTITSMLKGVKNPTDMLMNMAKNNPQANMILNAMKSGGNPKDMFYELAKQRGVNPEEIINIAKNISGNNS